MRIERRPAELAAAALTGAVGIAAVWGSSELGAAWTTSGPEPGYFPFYVGLILIAASLCNAVAVLRARPAEEPWLTPEQSRRLIGFLIPLVLYVAATVWLRLYVASAAYVAFNARFRGGYRVLTSLAVGIAFSALLHAVFELAFKVPLLKARWSRCWTSTEPRHARRHRRWKISVCSCPVSAPR